MDLKTFCLDVDGVMTDGTFWYDEFGKHLKRFGADDADALALLRDVIEIVFVSADHRGFPISEARLARDLGYRLDLVPIASRAEWIDRSFGYESVAYMGDSFRDAPILKRVALGIAPSNASPMAKRAADFVTEASGGHGAVAEACFYLAHRLDLDIPELRAWPRSWPDFNIERTSTSGTDGQLL